MKKKLFAVALMLACMQESQAQNAVLRYKTIPASSLNSRVSRIIQPTENPSSITALPNPSNGFIGRNTASRSGGPNAVQFADFVNLGSSFNIYTVVGSSYNYFWANPQLNTISFARRGDGQPASSAGQGVGTGNNIYQDLSTDGGTNWVLNAGPTSPSGVLPDGVTSILCRYPQGVIYNPVGNTVAANAYHHVVAPVTDGVNWNGLRTGTRKLGSSTPAVIGYIPRNDKYKLLIPDYLTITPQGTSWFSDNEQDEDTLVIGKGVFNAATEGFDYTLAQLPTGEATGIAHHSINFGPSGQVGYVTMLADVRAFSNQRRYFPVISKTTNGGNSWSGFAPINLDTVRSLQALRDSIAGDSTSLIGADGDTTGPYRVYYTTAFTHETAVDKNNNLHIFCFVGAAGYSNDTTAIANSIISSVGALVHIYTTNQGQSWTGRKIYNPQTFRGCFGDCPSGEDRVEYDLREQCGIDATGSKVFFSWFDTDAILYPEPIEDLQNRNNRRPDVWSAAYDVDNNKRVPPTNMTLNSLAEADVMVGNMSYYILTKPNNNFVLPIGSTKISTNLGSIGDQAPFTHRFVSGIEITPAMFVDDITSIRKSKNDGIAYFNVYPNPTNAAINIEVSLAKATNTQVVVSDLTGRRLINKDFGMVATGNKQLELSLANLPAGVYFCTVLAGNSSRVQKIVKK